MRKFTKGFCRLAGVLLSFGIVMLIVGFCMGGRPQGLSIGWNNGPVLRRTPITTSADRSGARLTSPSNESDIQELMIDIGAASVEINGGSEFSLEVTEGLDYTSTVQDGIWIISNENSQVNMNLFGNNEPHVTLTIPDTMIFKKITLDIGAGSLKAASLHTGEAYVSIGAGSMKLYDFNATGNTDIDVGMGTLNLSGTLNGYNYINCGMGTAKFTLERPAQYGYNVNCGMGTVKIDGSSTGGMGSDMSKNNDSDTMFDVECGMGTVKIEFTQSGSNNDATETADSGITPPSPPSPPDAPEAPEAPKAPTAP